MKRTKRFMSLVLAMSVLLTAFSFTMPVSAAGEDSPYVGDYRVTPSEWYIGYSKNGTSNIDWNKTQDYLAINRTGGVDGSAAVVVTRKSPVEENRYISLVQDLVAGLENGSTYRISFMAKSPNNMSIATNISFINETIGGLGKCTATEREDGWTLYTRDVTIPAEKTANKFNVIFEYKGDCLFDNLSLQKVVEGNADGTELLKNGDFEKYNDVETAEEDDDENGFGAPYKLSSAWSMEIHRGTEDTKDSDGNVTAEGTWRKADPEKQYAIPTTDAKTGGYALKFHWNRTDWPAQLYMMCTQSAKPTLEANTTYVVEYWAKTDVKGDIGQLKFGGDLFGSSINSNLLSKNIVETDSNGWSKYRYTIKTGENGYTDRFGFIFQAFDGSVIIDDIVVAKDLNGNGQVDKDETNIIEDGGFEDTIELPPRVREDKYKFTNNIVESGNWTAGGNNHWVDYSKKVMFAEPSAYMAHGGTYSLHIAGDGAYSGNYFLNAYGTGAGFEQGKTYTFVFYGKGIEGNLIASSNATWGKGISTATREDAGDGWTKYTMQVTPTQPSNTDWRWRFWGDSLNCNMFIDDLKITDSEGNVKVTENFESVQENLPYTTKFTNVAARSTVDGYLNISWKNPKSDTIKSLDVYVDGETANNNSYVLDSEAENRVTVDGLELGVKHEVKVVATFTDGTTLEAETTGTPTKQTNYWSWGGWMFERNIKGYTTNGMVYKAENHGDITVDNAAGNDGSAIKLEPKGLNYYSNIYPHIRQTFTVKKGEKNRLSLRAKSEGSNHLYIIADYRPTGKTGSWSAKGLIQSNESPDGWNEYTVDINEAFFNTSTNNEKYKDYYDPTGNDTEEIPVTLYIALDYGDGTVWIDDVKFCNIYEDDNEDMVMDESTNKIINGTFDETYEILAPEFTDAEGNAIDKLITGKVKVNAKIKNYSYTGGFNAFVAIGLYNGSTLEQLTTAERKVSITSSDVPADEFKAEFDIADIDAGEYSIKIMYWDGSATMVPLKAADVISE